nr:hypothetical protein [Phyllobacterium phragmitis]
MSAGFSSCGAASSGLAGGVGGLDGFSGGASGAGSFCFGSGCFFSGCAFSSDPGLGCGTGTSSGIAVVLAVAEVLRARWLCFFCAVRLVLAVFFPVGFDLKISRMFSAFAWLDMTEISEAGEMKKHIAVARNARRALRNSRWGRWKKTFTGSLSPVSRFLYCHVGAWHRVTLDDKAYQIGGCLAPVTGLQLDI